MPVGHTAAVASIAEDTLVAFRTSADHNLAGPAGHTLVVHTLADRNLADIVPVAHILVGHSRNPSAAVDMDWPSRQRKKTQPSVKNGQQA